MDRTAALAYLHDEYQELSDDAEIATDRQLRAYNSAVDQSLRELGYQEIDIPTAIELVRIQSYMALLDYFVLVFYSRIFALRTDVNVAGALQAARSQTFKQIMELLRLAENRLINQGFNLNHARIRGGRVNLDYLTPPVKPSEEFTPIPISIPPLGWEF
jgi:hypothetical protein